MITSAFYLGRYSAPKTTTDKSVEETKNTHTETTTIKQPDGTVKTVTVTDTSKQVSKDTKTSVAPNVSKVNVSLLSGYDYAYTSRPVYGVSISKEVIGPVTAGVFGLSNGIVGVSVGVNF